MDSRIRGNDVMNNMTEQALFRSILHRAWLLLRERPLLWFFGFISAGILNLDVVVLLGSLIKFLSNTVTSDSVLFSEQLSVVYTWLTPPYNNLYLPFFGILYLLAGLIIFLMMCIAFGALIRGVVDAKKQPLATLWHHGTSHMWHMAGLIIARRILLTLLLIGGFSAATWVREIETAFSGVLLLLIWVLVILFFLIISFLSIFTAVAMCVDRLHLFDAFKKGVQVLQSHVLVSIEMSIMLFGVEVMILILGAGLFVLIAIPVFIAFIVSIAAKYIIIFKIAMLIAMAALTIIGMILAGFYTVFQIATWSSLYVKTREGVISSRVLNFFGFNK